MQADSFPDELQEKPLNQEKEILGKKGNMQQEVITKNIFITWREEVTIIIIEDKRYWLQRVKNGYLTIVIVTEN